MVDSFYMKTNYIVIFEDSVESYRSTLRAAKETVDEMVEMYQCRSLSESEIRKSTDIYRVSRIRTKVLK